MKKMMLILNVFGPVIAAWAIQYGVFTGWRSLIQGSSDIMVISTSKCSYSPNGVVFSDCGVISVLKGGTNNGMIHLRSLYPLCQGERFLVFANHYEDRGTGIQYDAIEDFRIIPLNHFFQTNVLADKPLNEQVQIILKSRLVDLNRVMARDMEEKKRIEGALQIDVSNDFLSNAPPFAPESRPPKGGTSY